MKIYLIKHGEKDWNHIIRFQGREDIELNAAGIAQAVRCGQTLQGLGIEAVYTSPLKRAHCTGEEIAAQIGLSRDGVEPMQELIERDLGPFSGQLVKDKKEYFEAIPVATILGYQNPCRRNGAVCRCAETHGACDRASCGNGASGSGCGIPWSGNQCASGRAYES